MPPFATPVSPIASAIGSSAKSASAQTVAQQNEPAEARGSALLPPRFFASAQRRAQDVAALAEAIGRSQAVDYDSAVAMLSDAELVIAAQRQRIAFLEGLAMTDELTGVHNRRGFLQALERSIAAAERDVEAMGVLLLVDLDHFKKLNDTHGHPAGDAMLRLVAETLQAAVRPADLVARLGGDEFAVLMAPMRPNMADMRATTLMQSLNRSVLNWHERKIAIRASVGAVAFCGADHVEALLTKADERLYAMKRAR